MTRSISFFSWHSLKVYSYHLQGLIEMFTKAGCIPFMWVCLLALIFFSPLEEPKCWEGKTSVFTREHLWKICRERKRQGIQPDEESWDKQKTSVRQKKERGRKEKGEERTEVRRTRGKEKKGRKRSDKIIRLHQPQPPSESQWLCLHAPVIKSHFRQLLHEVYGSVSNHRGKVAKLGSRNAPVPAGCLLCANPDLRS